MKEKFPKRDIFKVPEGYFDGLPDKILERSQNEKKTVFLDIVKYAAAAVLVIGLIYFITPLEQNNEQNLQVSLMEEEIEFYIESDFWKAEDILALVDNPDELLDEILAEEWSVYEEIDLDDWDEIWF
jgi:hypothetical protein